ncbi:hypothetical protein B0T16DRAFT_422254 [Cercophora newfieldiana]|uniref:Uncharacterized protein n=1 Tax=Cercophora newfieldiana TaxID=92897 RepID=A0AA39XRQ5_9PEZI|nr:hypothetical protein B0T16DRAFT_422254 [Cercophora newfieldiana]
MTPSHTVTLPAEILLTIAESVGEPALVWKGNEPADPDPPNGHLVLKTLYNLCLASRSLRSAAQQTMYTEISLGYGQEAYEDTPCCSWNGRLACLITTLTTRPDLAARTKRAFIHPNLVTAVTEAEFASIVESAKRALGIADSPPALDQLPSRLQFLTFSLMPNLEHLIMRPLGMNLNFFGISDWMSLDLGPKTGFQNLRSAEFIEFPSHLGYWPLPCDCPTRKWRLTTLTLRTDFSAPDITNAVTGVANLRILDVRVEPRSLTTLLGPRPRDEPLGANLNSFYFASTPERSFTYDNFGAGTHFSSRDLVTALSPSRRTLRHLHMDMSFVYYCHTGPNPEISTLGEFEALETLAMSPCCIDRSGNSPKEWLPRFLPQSLRSLSMLRHEYVPLPESAIIGLCDAIRSGSFPELRQIRYSTTSFKGASFSSSRQAFLKQAFAKLGVDFCIVDEPDPRWLQRRLGKMADDSLERERLSWLTTGEDDDDDL